jgi:hypothetical protein
MALEDFDLDEVDDEVDAEVDEGVEEDVPVPENKLFKEKLILHSPRLARRSQRS